MVLTQKFYRKNSAKKNPQIKIRKEILWQKFYRKASAKKNLQIKIRNKKPYNKNYLVLNPYVNVFM